MFRQRVFRQPFAKRTSPLIMFRPLNGNQTHHWITSVSNYYLFAFQSGLDKLRELIFGF